MRIVFLDVDGTLVHDDRHIAFAYNYVFNFLSRDGVPSPEECLANPSLLKDMSAELAKVKPLIKGKNSAEKLPVIMSLFPGRRYPSKELIQRDLLQEAAIAGFEHMYATGDDARFDGALEFVAGLARLRDAMKVEGEEIKLVAATANTREGITTVLRKAALLEYFDVVGGFCPELPATNKGQQMRLLREMHGPADVCFKVGDAPQDMLYGKEAGCRTIGVGAAKGLKEAGAEAVFERTRDGYEKLLQYLSHELRK